MLPLFLSNIIHNQPTWLSTIGQPLFGGMLIGAAAALLLGSLGRIAGISGIVGQLLSPPRDNGALELGWRAAFLAGLTSVGLGVASFDAAALLNDRPRSWGTLIAAGLLVGFGTRLGGGCTSGHGVCGISRLSPRSIAATLTFIAAGAATVTLLRAMAVGEL